MQRELLVRLLRRSNRGLRARVDRLKDDSAGEVGEGDLDGTGRRASSEGRDWSVGREVKTQRAEGQGSRSGGHIAKRIGR